jgi:pre-rRNA-processing protein TSR2
MDDFRAGVTACLRSWSAFRTAVESSWGGSTRESLLKAEELRRHIYELFDGRNCPPANYSVEDLADNLAIYLEEEFSVTLEDQSEQQVAEMIFRMYETCSTGDVSVAHQMVAHAERAISVVTSQYPIQIQSTEHDDSDSDDDDDEMIDTDDALDATADTAKVQQQQQQQQQPQQQPGDIAMTTTTTTTTTPRLMTTPAEYAAAPLFGPPIQETVTSTGPPPRQLGDAIPEEPTVEVDEDGFAPVKTKGKRR